MSSAVLTETSVVVGGSFTETTSMSIVPLSLAPLESVALKTKLSGPL